MNGLEINGIPNRIEGFVLLRAREQFLASPETRKRFIAAPFPTLEEEEVWLRRYCRAALKNAKDDRMWPGNPGNP